MSGSVRPIVSATPLVPAESWSGAVTPRPTQLVAQALRKPATPREISNALREILGDKAAQLKAQIGPRDLDRRLPVGDAVRLVLLSRIGSEAAKLVVVNRANLVQQLRDLWGQDRAGDRMSLAEDARFRGDHLRDRIGLLDADSPTLAATRKGVDMFIRAQFHLVSKP
jgi:hypothetical protein